MSAAASPAINGEPIVTEHIARGRGVQWMAHLAEYDLGSAMGYGNTEAEAIEDLRGWLEMRVE